VPSLSSLLALSPSALLLSDGGTAMPSKTHNETWKQEWDRLRPSPCIAAEMHQRAVVLQDRDYPDEPAITVIDGTRAELFAYSTFQYQKLPLFFCTDDGFETMKDAPVLVHCSDNLLLQTCSESMVVMVGTRQLQVRFLTLMNEAMRFAVRDYFKGRAWPPRPSEITKVVDVETPLRVLSVEGRLFIDGVHLDAFKVMPRTPLTVINASPGAGKSAAIKPWKNKNLVLPRLEPAPEVLVIVFNKSNQEALQAEFMGVKGCTVRTLDAVIASVTTCHFEPSYEKSIDEEEQERLQTERVDTYDNERI